MFTKEFLDKLISPETIISLIIVIVTFVVLHIVSRQVKKAEKKDSAHKDRHMITRLIINIVKYFVVFFIIVMILQINGINVGAMVTGFGIVSVIVGLALQDAIRDIFNGINIVTDRYFRVGDVVRYGDIEGKVISFSVRTTKIRSIYDQSVTVVANRNISEITVVSHQVDIDIHLAYDDDYRIINDILRKTCEKIALFDEIEGCEYKGIERFGDSAIDYKIRFFCSPVTKPETSRHVMRTIQEDLDAADIDIPFPQITVHQA